MMQQQAPRQVIAAIRDAEELIFDVDLTLTERQKSLAPDLAQVLARTRKRLGICTSRALSELDEVFDSEGDFSRPNLMRGPIVLEDGGVIVRPGADEPELLVSPQHHQAVRELVDHISSRIDRNGDDSATWYRLEGLSSPLVHLPTRYNYQTSFSIWQQVAHPAEKLEELLPKTMNWVERVANELGVSDLVHLLEIGDGTLRIAAPGRSKGVALRELHEAGAIDLARTIYFGDGKNDVPAAHVVREYGGSMIAVDTHCNELVQLSNFVLPQKGPEGLRRFLTSLFRF